MTSLVESKKFSAKVLLFGEYSLIKESMGLAIPYNVFGGYLNTSVPHSTIEVDSEIYSMLMYLKDSREHSTADGLIHAFLDHFNFSLFEHEVIDGLRFSSSIPQGYGLGSSGALCAAIYDRYADDHISSEITTNRLTMLKKIFSFMESHFHGASSGIDPLISYCNHPLLIRCMTDLHLIEIPDYSDGNGAIFLLNTKRARRTEPLVNLFLEKSNSASFAKLCNNVLKPITNNCIQSFLDKDKDSLFEFFRELSDFQYRYFTPMIPKLFRQIWRNGLRHEEYYLKLCGSGGGGFILGICPNWASTQALLSSYELKPLFFL